MPVECSKLPTGDDLFMDISQIAELTCDVRILDIWQINHIKCLSRIAFDDYLFIAIPEPCVDLEDVFVEFNYPDEL